MPDTMLTFTLDLKSIGTFVIALVAAVLAVLVLRELWRFLKRVFASPELHGLDRKGIRARWEEIERLAGGSEMQLKMAVLEADKLLDHALKAMAMPGMTLGERLKFAAYKHPRINKVWWAHKLRNQIAHESSFYLEPHMARRAVREFKAALQMLNLL